MKTIEHPRNTLPDKFTRWLDFWDRQELWKKLAAYHGSDQIKWTNVHNRDGEGMEDIYYFDVDYVKARCFEDLSKDVDRREQDDILLSEMNDA